MTRRETLKTLALLGAQALFPYHDTDAEAKISNSLYAGKISLYNEHTAEHISVQYLNKSNGHLDKEVWQKLNRFFRCHYDGQMHPIHPMLFLLLDIVRCQLKAKERPFCLFSGYRSPTYNRMLCCEDARVANHSYHLKGMAADITLEGVSKRDIVKVAKRLKLGGVGIYDDFVHLDVGPWRTW